MKKRVNPRRKDDFMEGASALLDLISGDKKELRMLMNEELKALRVREREGIKLVKEKAKKEREGILKRYEKGKEQLGKVLLKKKKRELGTRVSVEKRLLGKSSGEARKIERALKKIRKR